MGVDFSAIDAHAFAAGSEMRKPPKEIHDHLIRRGYTHVGTQPETRVNMPHTHVHFYSHPKKRGFIEVHHTASGAARMTTHWIGAGNHSIKDAIP